MLLKQPESGNIYISKNFSELSLALPDSPEDFFIPEYRGDEASLSEILASYFAEDSQRIYAARKLHKRSHQTALQRVREARQKIGIFKILRRNGEKVSFRGTPEAIQIIVGSFFSLIFRPQGKYNHAHG